jgi:hypothetical protein
MISQKNHEQAFAELDAVAFDLLDGVEREAVMSHVAKCSECRSELDALQETAAGLAFGAPSPPHAASAIHRPVRQRLFTRAGHEPEARKASLTPILFPATPSIPPPPQAGRLPWLLSMAAGLLFVASVGVLAFSLRDRRPLVDALKSQALLIDSARRTADSLSTELAARDSIVAAIDGRDVSVFALTSKAIKGDPYARMFWDRARHTWMMIAHKLPDLRHGRTYQLWLITPKSKVSAGTFTARDGEAVVRATYTLGESLTAIAVTDEPAGGVRQPTGNTIVVALTR